MAYTTNGYKYKGASDVLRVEFDVTPDLSAGVAPGETLIFDGKITNTGVRKIGGWQLRVWSGNSSTPPDPFNGITVGYTTFKLAMGNSTGFSFRATAESIARLAGSGRITPLRFCFRAWDASTSAGYDMPMSNGEALTYLRYRLNGEIPEMEFGRCKDSGEWADDGTRLRCKALRFTRSGQSAQSEFTVAKIVCSGSDKSLRTFNLNSTQLSQAFSASGYSETGYNSSNIFFGFTAATGVTYTLTMMLGDGYDTAQKSDAIVHSFARFHLSGASHGGVAVGMFSSATDQEPKFEVDKTHNSYFYGNVNIQGEMTLGAGKQHVYLPVGFDYIVLENESSSTKQVSGHLDQIPFATKYVCTGVLGWSANARPGWQEGPPVIDNTTRTITATLAGNSTILYGIMGFA